MGIRGPRGAADYSGQGLFLPFLCGGSMVYHPCFPMLNYFVVVSPKSICNISGGKATCVLILSQVRETHWVRR